MGIAIRDSRKEPVFWQAGVNYNNKGSRAVIGSCCIGENSACNLQKNAHKMNAVCRRNYDLNADIRFITPFTMRSQQTRLNS
jgi:hypothetical protein